MILFQNVNTPLWDPSPKKILEARRLNKSPRALEAIIKQDAKNCIATSLSTTPESKLGEMEDLIQHAQEIMPYTSGRDLQHYEELISELSLAWSILSLESQLRTPRANRELLLDTMKEIRVKLDKAFKKKALTLLFHEYPNKMGILPYLVTNINNRPNIYDSPESQELLISAIKTMVSFSTTLDDNLCRSNE